MHMIKNNAVVTAEMAEAADTQFAAAAPALPQPQQVAVVAMARTTVAVKRPAATAAPVLLETAIPMQPAAVVARPQPQQAAVVAMARPQPLYNKRLISLMAFMLFVMVCLCFSGRAFAALAIEPLPSPGAETAPTASMVPITTPTPRPKATPENQLGKSVTPTPSPTADPMINESIRNEVNKVFTSHVEPTPAKASRGVSLSVRQAAAGAIHAADPSFKTMEISRSNIQKSIDTLRNSVNMAIQALDADDRYHELLDAEDLWEEDLDPELAFELDMYRQMKYEELTSDQRRQLIMVRDLGYEQFNFNITQLDYNVEIMKNQLTYGAYAQYSGIAKMQAAIALQKEALELQNTNLEILKKKYELGMATRIDVEDAELSYEKSKIDLRRQQRSLTSLITGFNKLLGENLATTYQDFDRTKLTPTLKDKSVNVYITSALKNRSEILIAQESLSLAQRQAALYDNEISNARTLNDKQDAIQAAQEAEIKYDLAVQDVRSGINDAYKQLVALRGLKAYYESQIQTAQDNYDKAQKLYEYGMTTAVSVDQVRMSLTQAKMQLEMNLIDTWLQQQKLEIMSGIGPGNI